MKTFTAACIVDARAAAGESPVWSSRERVLYWVDIWGRRLHRYDPANTCDVAYPMPDIVAFASHHADGGLVVCLRETVWHVALGTHTFRLIAELPLPFGARLNDATVDAQGRLWIGAMASAPERDDGQLWRIDVDGTASVVVDRLRSPNGLAFAPDGATMYLSDSHPAVRTIWSFDVDPRHGSISRQRVFRDTRELRGRPDGGAVDVTGRYWMAAVDGGCVLGLDPNGNVDAIVDVPVEKPSKAAFGGTDLTTLYVTSLRRNLVRPLEQQPQAGGLFAAEVDVSGVPLPACRVAIVSS